MSRNENGNPLMTEPRGPRWGRILGIVLVVLLAMVVLGGVGIYFYGHSLIGRANFVSDDQVKQLETLPAEAYEEKTTEQDGLKGASLNQSELGNIQKKMNQENSKVDTIMDSDVYNVLLCGVDRRDKTWNGNSDSMMLVSLNNEKKRVSVISLMRDTYVAIPGHDYEKLNAAYAYGGGPLLLETVRNNYKIDVTRYAAVDFMDMVDVIDDMGGVELTWTDQEVEVANGYMIDMCQNVLNIPYEEHLLPGGGTYNCDGVQAVAYSRNRFVGNSDYTRTQRQRYVVSQMVEKLKSMSATDMMAFVTKVLPLITHNIPETEIWNLVNDAPQLLKYDYVQDRVPYDGLYDTIDVDGQGMLVPDWDDTISQMQRTIYGDGSISKNEDNQKSNVGSDKSGETEFTDEYLQLTGGTGTLFKDGYPTQQTEGAVSDS